ncbi:MAG: hydantoinase/oxoprolinase family protein [Actinomycetota bacterium]|nr:hydantoinase/oxoprolinase family protein [Actinomycetota bacterium]
MPKQPAEPASGSAYGADTGGTFTDVVGQDGRVTKVLSTPADPGRAVRAGLAELDAPPSPARLGHGTTVPTNALLERRGARVALVTNAGFEDVIEIARQDRPSLYDPFTDRPEPLVAPGDRFGVPGRLGSDGAELEPCDPSAIPALDGDIEAVAVCLLHSDLNADHERAVARELERRGHDVTCSVDVSPEVREYERTVTTVVNAYLRPPCRAYLTALTDVAARVEVMTSAGGLVDLERAAQTPARLLLSGPAGGVAAGAEAARRAGFPDAVTFDMGGTSTDVCLVLGGVPEPAPQRVVAGLPVRLPSLDIHTIGAGGGSIARIDAGGALMVGPQSAGASPGPACYGRGGMEATVTDADLVLGRIPAEASFGSLGQLDLNAARAALEGLDPAGVVAVVDEAMVQAVRAVTVERGVDPKGLAVVAFGGAGPLHACAIAAALDMRAVVVPARAGVLSAVGILCSPRQADLVRSWPSPGDHTDLQEALDRLATDAARQLDEWADVTVAVDCRYAGQSHEISVPSVAAFHDEHERRNGYRRPDVPVEVVALRATARSRTRTELPEPVTPRAEVTGPAVVAEPDCTIWVPEGWVGRPAGGGALVLERTS